MIPINHDDDMEIHRYFVGRRETIYNLLIALAMILLYFVTYNIGSWIIPRDIHLARKIIELSPLLGIFAVIIAAFLLKMCLDSMVNPKFSVCSHFLIIRYSSAIAIPWNEIFSVEIRENKIKVKYKRDSRVATCKETIKHVIDKENLIEKIKGNCAKFQKDFSQ